MEVNISVSDKSPFQSTACDAHEEGKLTLSSVQGTDTSAAKQRLQSPMHNTLPHSAFLSSLHKQCTLTICWNRCSLLKIRGSLAETGREDCGKAEPLVLGVLGALVGSRDICACVLGRLKSWRGGRLVRLEAKGE